MPVASHHGECARGRGNESFYFSLSTAWKVTWSAQRLDSCRGRHRIRAQAHLAAHRTMPRLTRQLTVVYGTNPPLALGFRLLANGSVEFNEKEESSLQPTCEALWNNGERKVFLTVAD